MNNNEETARLIRINELAKKAKTIGLSEEEIKERNILRKEFLVAFRNNVKSTIDNITIVENDGSHTPLSKKDI